MPKKQLAVIRLWHEGNSFSPVRTGAEEFRRREWIAPGKAREHYRGTATEMGAVFEFLDRNPDWQAEVLLAAAAPPGGPVEDALFDKFRLAALEAGHEPYDAVYLSLHGALLTESDPTPELNLLRELRPFIGEGTPLAVTFDLHGNLAPEIADIADIALAYKTYPHIDMRETAAKALELLAATVEGRIRPRLALAKVPAILPSFNMRTESGPMAEAEALARRIERERGLLDVSPLGGFAYGDTPHAGASVLALADGDAEAARGAADEVARFLWANRARFRAEAPAPSEGIAKALSASPGLVAVLDPADNPMSGGIGDTPELFRALLASAPQVPTVFAFFCDPALVGRAKEAGEGARLKAMLGGRFTGLYGTPVQVEARVLRLTDGRFVNRGPMETGLPVALGNTAVLGIGGWLRVIVTEACQSPNDIGYFDLHGIDLGSVRLLCVKAKNHFRAAFGPLCRAILEVDAPGPAGFDLGRYPFRHAPRGLVRAVAEARSFAPDARPIFDYAREPSLEARNTDRSAPHMPGRIDARLAELKIELPKAAAPVANYVPVVIAGGLAFVSGQVTAWNGEIKFRGKLGRDFTIEQGQEAARLCALNVIAQLRAALGGDLDRAKRCVKLGIFVNSMPDFTDQPKVGNGASDLIVQVFGDAGKHARFAVGTNVLPLDVAVEVDAVFEVA